MVFTSLIAAAVTQTGAVDVRLMRFPDVHGGKYVFTYASDLWIAERDGGFARRLTSHPGLESSAHFSPDGKWIAFTGQYDGGADVYVISSEGGEVRRLTYEAGGETVRGWTPDGKKIAFTTSLGNHTNRMPRLWMVSFDGGLPERTDLQEATALSFSPDGKQIAFNRNASFSFNWRLYRGGTQGRIAFWNFADRSYTEIPAGRDQNYFPMWVGDDVYFISDRAQRNLNIFKYDTKSKRTTQVTRFTDGDVRWPATDGKTIVFERNLRLFSMDIASGEITMLQPRILSDNLPMRARTINLSDSIDGLALSPSGKRVTAEARGEVFSVPATRGNTRNLTETAGARERASTWSTDGQFIYYLTDRGGEWQLARRPQMGGAEEIIKTPAGDNLGNRSPVLSYAPKGERIAYVTSDNRLVVLDIKSGQTTQVTQNNGGSSPQFDWSPDGEWVVFTESKANGLTGVSVMKLATKEVRQLTSGYYGDSAVTWDRSGNYIYFASNRTWSPSIGTFEITMNQLNTQRVYMIVLSADAANPMDAEDDEEPVRSAAPAAAPAAPAAAPAESGIRIDLEGIDQRTLALPYPPGSYPLLVGVREGVLVWRPQGGELTLYSVRQRRPLPVISGIQGAVLNADRTKFAYVQGPLVGISDVRPGVEPGTGRVNFGDVTMTVNPREEFSQMLKDAWRFNRDYFYDPKMMGVDWNAVGKKYMDMIPFAGDRGDLDYVLGLMIGELGTGHACVTPGFAGFDPMSPPPAMLGADFEAVGNNVRFRRILRGNGFDPSMNAPLGAVGVNVKEGEFLLEIDGKAVTRETGVSAHLLGKSGKRVTLTVNSTPSLTGARKVQVRPVPSETNLRYQTWVQERRALVNKASGGRLGYMHIPDTSVSGIIGFIDGFYSQTDKEGWVIDERYNGGGFIPTFFIEQLSRRMVSVFGPRHGRPEGLPSALNGPKAMLINEHAGSEGDMLPYLFKREGLGPLIGTRTWGGLVGIQGFYDLAGGGGVTAPSFGIYDPKSMQWIAENRGVDPDIEVDDRPDLAARGQDVQLDRAIKWLMDRLPAQRQDLRMPPMPRIGENGGGQ